MTMMGRWVVGGVLVVALALVAGCSGSGGTAVSGRRGLDQQTPTSTVRTVSLDAQDAGADAATSQPTDPVPTDPALAKEALTKAVDDAWSVHVEGSVRTSAGTSTLTASVHKKGGFGVVEGPQEPTVAGPAVRVEFVRVDSDFYLRSDSPVAYQRLVPASEIPATLGRWVQVRTADPRMRSLSDFTSLPTIVGWAQGISLGQYQVQPNGLVVWTNPITSAQVALPPTGPALPAWVRRDDPSVQASLTYSAWNQPVQVHVPSLDSVTRLATPTQ